MEDLPPPAGYPPPKVACNDAGSLMESCLSWCGGPPLAGYPPWLADPPPLRDGWLGRSASTLTKRTCSTVRAALARLGPKTKPPCTESIRLQVGCLDKDGRPLWFRFPVRTIVLFQTFHKTNIGSPWNWRNYFSQVVTHPNRKVFLWFQITAGVHYLLHLGDRNSPAMELFQQCKRG